VQLCIILGMVFLYIYMLKSRAKYVKGLEKLRAQYEKSEVSNTKAAGKAEKSSPNGCKSD
jgi:hypothetical protein